MKMNVITALLCLFFTATVSPPAHAHPWDPIPCEIGIWELRLNTYNQSEKSDLIRAIQLLTEQENAQVIKITRLYTTAFSDEVDIVFERMPKTNDQQILAGITHLVEQLKNLKGINIYCNQPIPTPRLSGSN